MLKILLADDHAMLREGLRHVLCRLADELEILEAGNFNDAIAIARDNPGLSLAVLDLNMPGMESFAGLQAVAAAAPTVPIVVMSGSENPIDMRRALDCGAMGYIPKSENTAVMLTALRLVLEGGLYVPPALLRQSETADTGVMPNPYESMTPRQRAVLTLIVQGKSNKDIARELDLSEATVKAHISAILRVFNVSNRTQAVLQAKKLGL